MASTASWNHQDTAGVTVGEIAPDALNFTLDFAKLETKANEATLVNLTSPTDRRETIRFGYTRIANVYSGSGLDPSVYAQNKTGVSVLAQVNSVLSYYSNADDTSSRVDLPVSAHLVLKVPNHEAITADILVEVINRLCGALFEQGGSSPGPRLTALIRGAVLPRAMV